jgi:hypothetical protein
MTKTGLTRLYSEIDPEERFRLILAAGARGDTVEQERLVAAGKKVTYVMPEHAPAAHAFNELALLTFIELQDAAGFYRDAMLIDEQDCHLRQITGRGDEVEAGPEENEGAARDEESIDGDDEGDETEDDGRWPGESRAFDVVLAAGCVFREKVRGWELFCERLSVPPYSLWTGLPGYDRFEKLLKTSESIAFTRKGLRRWLNRTKAAGEPDSKRVLSAERLADAAEAMYRERVKWWGG